MFRFPIDRRLYGYGRVLLNYDAMRKGNIPFWDVFMGKRDGAILALAVCMTILGVVRVFVEGAVTTGAWGLSFRQEGTAPIGNAGADQLRQFDAVYLGDTRQKRLYLTFDAGYENGATEKILDTLKAHNTKAAFFLVGNYIDRNRDLVRRMVEEGHIVGNHTMHHYDMSKLSDFDAFHFSFLL